MIQRNKLEELIQQNQSDHPFDISVVVDHPPSGEKFCYMADKIRPSASLIKLYILAALSIRIHEENLLWETKIIVQPYDWVPGAGIIKYMELPYALTVGDLATFMIKYSDNMATNKIIDLLSINYINRAIEKLGANYTKLKCKMMSATASMKNMTSASDVKLFYSRLFDASDLDLDPSVWKDCYSFIFGYTKSKYQCARLYVSDLETIRKSSFKKIAQFLVSIMANNNRDRIAENIPKRVPAGLRSAGDRNLFHDSGIFITSNGPMIIVILLESKEANFLNRRSALYLAAKKFCASIGEISLSGLY